MSEFISDDMVSAAVEYLAQDPHPIAVAKADMTRRENERKRKYATLFLTASGKTNADRDASVIADESYIAAQDEEAKAIQEYEEERSRQRNADMITELWRSVQANRRASERVF